MPLSDSVVQMVRRWFPIQSARAQPTTAKPWNAGQKQLEYKHLGLTFTLESGKVNKILMDFRTPK